ncbi:MAG: transposase [bacterium]|nr:transposase [bacterium]
MTKRAVEESEVIRVDASGRRRHSPEFKRRLTRLALEPGASVAGIARA